MGCQGCGTGELVYCSIYRTGLRTGRDWCASLRVRLFFGVWGGRAAAQREREREEREREKKREKRKEKKEERGKREGKGEEEEEERKFRVLSRSYLCLYILCHLFNPQRSPCAPQGARSAQKRFDVESQRLVQPPPRVESWMW